MIRSAWEEMRDPLTSRPLASGIGEKHGDHGRHHQRIYQQEFEFIRLVAGNQTKAADTQQAPQSSRSLANSQRRPPCSSNVASKSARSGTRMECRIQRSGKDFGPVQDQIAAGSAFRQHPDVPAMAEDLRVGQMIGFLSTTRGTVGAPSRKTSATEMTAFSLP